MSDYLSDCDSQYDDYWYEDDEELYDECDSLVSYEGYDDDNDNFFVRTEKVR